MQITIDLKNGYVVKAHPSKGYETDAIQITSITRSNGEIHPKIKDYYGMVDYDRLVEFMMEIETETFYEEE
jgi:hypothetical protein